MLISLFATICTPMTMNISFRLPTNNSLTHAVYGDRSPKIKNKKKIAYICKIENKMG